MERWLTSRDSGCVPRQQRASWWRHWRAARSRTPTASSTPAFNGGAPRVGTNAQGLAWSTQSLRVPAVVQADGRIVVAGQRAGAATLARFNANGTLDTTYGTGGFVSARFAGTPTSQPGTSAATALALDPSGDVLATGFGASQSMFVARFSPTGAMTASVVCFAPHLIDYTAYAIAERPDGSVVIAGLGARPLARHALQVLRRASSGAGDRRIVQHATAAAPGAPRRRRASRSAPPASSSTASRTTARC